MQNIKILLVIFIFFVFNNMQAMKREAKEAIDPVLLAVVEDVIKKDPQLFDIRPRSTVKVAKIVLIEENVQKLHQCDECKFSTNNKKYFSVHKRNHRVPDCYVCDDCGFLTPTKRPFQDHLKNRGHTLHIM